MHMFPKLPFEIIQKIANLLAFTYSIRLKRTSNLLFRAVQWNNFDPYEDELANENNMYFSPIELAAMQGAIYPFKLMLKDKRIPYCISRILLVGFGNVELLNLLLSGFFELDNFCDHSILSEPHYNNRKVSVRRVREFSSSRDLRAELFSLLLADSRFNINHPEIYSEVLNVVSSDERNTNVLKKLLTLTHLGHSSDESALKIAIRFGNIEGMKILLEDSRFDPLAVFNWTLYLADELGNPELVKHLLTNDKMDTTGVLKAVVNGQIEEIKSYLAEGRFDVSNQKLITKLRKIIYFASSNINVNVADFLKSFFEVGNHDLHTEL
ncbi:hypothetical protein HK096_008904 [Nowakowskiella sp. JEL0078]|nr:hypothetical protein HK096_008904 [Nowakowskiella sp. JEL0078]